MTRQRRHKTREGFHEVDLFEVTVVGEDGSSTQQLVELPVDGDIDDLVGYAREVLCVEKLSIAPSGSAMAHRPEPVTMEIALEAIAEAIAPELSDEQLETLIEIRQSELERTRGRSERLQKCYALDEEKLAHRGVAPPKVLKRRGRYHLDPVSVIRDEMINLADEIKTLRQTLRERGTQAVALNKQAAALAPDAIAALKARFSKRATNRIVEPGKQN